MNLQDLLNRDLKGWCLKDIFILYQLDQDGSIIPHSLLLFKEELIPKTLHNNNPTNFKVIETIVLTNETDVVLLDDGNYYDNKDFSNKNLKIFEFEDEDKAIEELKKTIINNKLTLQEQQILGLI